MSLDGRGGKRVTLELTAGGAGDVEWHTAAVPGIVEPRDVNLLVFTIDSLRADHVGAYGYSRPTTPHIDAIAGHGTTFLEAFVSPTSQGPRTRAFSPGDIRRAMAW